MHGRVPNHMRPDTPIFNFKDEPSAPMREEIALLEIEGYSVHREWANGIELRKKSGVGSLGILGRCVLAFLMPVIFIPFFGRTILEIISGYKYRVFVTRDLFEPRVFLC
jgi:hypothetical protein